MNKMTEPQMPSDTPDMNAEKSNILIVDDNPFNLELLADVIRKQGYEPRPVPNGRLALVAAQKDPPDLILLDINMANMNGFEVCKRLKADAALKDIPVIFITGLNETADKVKAFSMGAVDYITKPFQNEEVCARVETHMRLRRLQKEVDKYNNHLEGVVQEKIKEIYGNITKRIEAEDKLRLLAAAVEQTGESICITDPKGVIQYVNPAFEQTTGYTSEEAIGKTPRIIYSDVQGKDFYLELWKCISGGKIWEGRIVNKRKDGSLYTESSIISPIRDDSGRIISYVSVKRDITENLQLQAMLNQSQKMEAIGHLSGGVAHDFNNLLSVINGYSQLLVSDPDLNASNREQIQEILHAGESASSLTRQLLMFSRHQAIEPKVIDINKIVSDMNKMLKRLVRENIAITMDIGTDLWLIKADPGSIEQVIVNLAVNASDAMPDGGKLTVKTENLKIDSGNRIAHESVIAPGLYVMFSVSDTGCGMDENIRNHIFEPFFTTKGIGKGTGLGLPTVYAVVKQSNAHIVVQSEPEKGTMFQIYFPKFVNERAASEAIKEEENFPRGSETILIAEDQDSIRLMLKNFLESIGYNVLIAGNGKEALELAGSHKGQIHLLLADLVLTGMNGLELAKCLKNSNPRIELLLMSGYANPTDTNKIMDTTDNFIDKPICIHALAVKLRSILGK
jgi:PAS domain S-box-containing protein